MIGIIGGGISGLLLLHSLRERGMDAILFEASDTPGGVMRSRSVAGPNGPVTVDLGPQRMRLTPGIAEILAQLGRTEDLIHAPRGIPFSMYYRGRMYPAPFSFGAALTTPLISGKGKIRALADLVTPAPKPDESVAAALTRKLGPEIYVRLAGPLLGGLYGSDPAEMDAEHTLIPALRRSGQTHSLLVALRRLQAAAPLPVVSLRNGMGSLPIALAERHRDHLVLDSPVLSVERGRPGKLKILTAQDEVEVRRVAVTVPAPAAAELLRSLDSETANDLAQLRYNPLAVVPLVVPRTTPAPRMGSGFKLTLDEPGPTRGVTAHEELFGRKGLFTAFLGGRGHEDVLDRSDDAIRELAEVEFQRMTGAQAQPLLVHRTWMPAWDSTWRRFDDLNLPSGIHVCAAFGQRPGLVGRLEDARRTADLLAGSVVEDT
jgi:protoporphyrinogen/coproporphyrinogen III oxidase